MLKCEEPPNRVTDVRVPDVADHVTAKVTPPIVVVASIVQPQETIPSLPAQTTFQEDLTTAGQRAINLKWESTQQVIAIMVTASVLITCTYVVIVGPQDLKLPAFVFLTNIAFLVVGTYFQRTNHTKTGGVGPNAAGR